MAARPDFGGITALARRTETEAEAIRELVRRLRETLGERWISRGGSALTLREYLDTVAAGGATGGDEQDVVDRLVLNGLLPALGYMPADVDYNRRLGSAGAGVPDFVVRLHDLPGSPRVLVIESKATSVRDFTRPQHRGSAPKESPLGQLRRYVLSGVVTGRTGLICNGWQLEVWAFGGDGDAPLARLDLHALSDALSSEGEPNLADAQQRALETLALRCSREAHVTAERILRNAIRLPPFPSEWVARLNERLAEAPEATAIDEMVFDYREAVWRDRALDVRQATEVLILALGDLIAQFSGDVRQQLDEALARAAEHGAALQAAEQTADLDRRLLELRLARDAFDLDEGEYRERFLGPLDAWTTRPVELDVPSLVARWMSGLRGHVRVSKDGVREQLSILSGQAHDNEAAAQLEAGRLSVARAAAAQVDRVMQDLGKGTRAYCEAALELAARRQQLRHDFRAALRAADSWQAWSRRVSSSVMVNADENALRTEFAHQTSYVYLIRLLTVRICEDKGLFERKLSDGGLIQWQETASRYLDYASGRSYEYLTRMAYECAQNVYQHFFGAGQVFDWYHMDEKMLLRALLVLDAFDLQHIDTDIIGTVYGHFLKEAKHEQGRYYTPRPLVGWMLDELGYRGGAVINRRLIDLACGSGSFLVEAARRILERSRGPEGRIPVESLAAALDEVQRSLHGIDLNPFACYLAETNLLIQVLDLLREAQEAGLMLTMDRFHIYCDDALLVDEGLARVPDAALPLLADERELVPRLIKARVGPYRDGFDYVIGNPPYVRADEPSAEYLAYRRLLEHQRWFTTRHLKWDLYVPFIEQYRRLLGEAPHARGCLITIESLGTAPYATKVRELLVAETTLHSVLFTVGLRLFEDAAWQDNIVFTFAPGSPPEGHRVKRLVASALAEDGRPLTSALDEPAQATLPPERAFTRRRRIELELTDTVPLGELFYVTKGMVQHSRRDIAPGQVLAVPANYDHVRTRETLVEDRGAGGKRIAHRPFGRDELVAAARDDVHTRRTLSSEGVLRGGLGGRQWLEHGPHTRCPGRVSRPTFPELYDRPKLMVGTFTGAAVDEGGAEGYFVVSHSVEIAIRWALLEGVDNRALSKARGALRAAGRWAPGRSDDVSEWYVCALFLSTPIQDWLASERRSMKDHVYPEDLKAIPVKLAPADVQASIEALARERHALFAQLAASEDDGFRGSPPEAPVYRLAGAFLDANPQHEALSLFQCLGRGLFEIEPGWLTRDLQRVRARQDTLRSGREVVARVSAEHADPTRAAALLAGFLRGLPGTFADRQQLDRLPGTPAGWAALAAEVDARLDAVRAAAARRLAIDAELDARFCALYGVKKCEARPRCRGASD